MQPDLFEAAKLLDAANIHDTAQAVQRSFQEVAIARLDGALWQLRDVFNDISRRPRVSVRREQLDGWEALVEAAAALTKNLRERVPHEAP